MKLPHQHRHTILSIICMLLVLLFTYAALTKLLEGDRFRTNLLNSPVMGGETVADLASWSIPLAELIVALLLCIPRFRLAGLYGALGLLLLFTAYTMGILFFAPYTPCSCGGIITLLSWEQHLALNGCCILLTMVGIRLAQRYNNNEKTELSRYRLDREGFR
ncbi:MAG: MauE/DoxX family redox-associated membrane protein [Sediminicola sp.]